MYPQGPQLNTQDFPELFGGGGGGDFVGRHHVISDYDEPDENIIEYVHPSAPSSSVDDMGDEG